MPSYLMTPPDHFRIAYSINPKMNPANSFGQVNAKDAQQEFDALVACHSRLGHHVELVEPPPFPDSIFTANYAVIIDGKVMLGSPRPAERRGEIPYARKMLEKLGYAEIEEAPYHFSGGGDALHIAPQLILTGQLWRTDPRMVPVLANYFDCQVAGFNTIAVSNRRRDEEPNSHFYDLDLAVAPLKFDESLAYCPEAFEPKERRRLEGLLASEGFRVYPVPLAEALKGCLNLISDGAAIMRPDVDSPALAAAIAAEGLTDNRLKVTELWKGGGAVRCTALNLN